MTNPDQQQVETELKNAGYDFAVAIATDAEINANAACGQLAIVTEVAEHSTTR
jgi:adenine C2-methylase RlmN of 23S rRNA A2503 and tRNA A37